MYSPSKLLNHLEQSRAGNGIDGESVICCWCGWIIDADVSARGIFNIFGAGAGADPDSCFPFQFLSHYYLINYHR
ncbi:hypothetical protein GUJ93_ZPchr0003g18364 [Zizania palustris]|uniref:Uncharacterized protein n=1 Tax=Zizania palustris TaxID=103762 RepID=A0A8J5S8Z7_ZIZPA|nr:hypothetical protein GUJ93_ZPchr0003g18364 [Zizania palustris]